MGRRLAQERIGPNVWRGVSVTNPLGMPLPASGSHDAVSGSMRPTRLNDKTYEGDISIRRYIQTKSSDRNGRSMCKNDVSRRTITRTVRVIAARDTNT